MYVLKSSQPVKKGIFIKSDICSLGLNLGICLAEKSPLYTHIGMNKFTYILSIYTFMTFSIYIHVSLTLFIDMSVSIYVYLCVCTCA